jgi:hypothetical protein
MTAVGPGRRRQTGLQRQGGPQVWPCGNTCPGPAATVEIGTWALAHNWDGRADDGGSSDVAESEARLTLRTSQREGLDVTVMSPLRPPQLALDQRKRSG